MTSTEQGPLRGITDSRKITIAVLERRLEEVDLTPGLRELLELTLDGSFEQGARVRYHSNEDNIAQATTHRWDYEDVLEKVINERRLTDDQRELAIDVGVFCFRAGYGLPRVSYDDLEQIEKLEPDSLDRLRDAFCEGEEDEDAIWEDERLV